LLSTNIVEDVAAICPRCAVVRRGRFIAYTTPTDARTTIDGTTFHGHTPSVAFLVFNPLGGRLASASSDQTVKVWDSSAGRESLVWRGRGQVVRLAFFPDSRWLVLGFNADESDDRIEPIATVLNTATVETVEQHSTGPNEADSVNGVAVSLSGNMVAAAFANQRAEFRAANFGASLATLRTPNIEHQAVHSAPTAPRWPWQAWRLRLTGTK
jgi:WD40 repeat protein